MTTSLAAQLRRLTIPTSNVLLDDKKRSSLLFDPKEAASISGQIFYEIGLEGLEQLIVKNEDFEQFKESLFHASSKDFDRHVRGKDENTRLNKTVRKFLVMLAPYVLTNPAHKALEWLFYRYAINEFNKRDLIMAFLPYYNSNIFCRVVQTLKFDDVNDPFCFLKVVQKSGMHLQRLDLFYQGLSNVSIIKYLTKFMNQLMDIHSKYSILTTQFNFYCTVLCGAIEFANEISEPFVTQMLPLILKGLNSSIPDYAAASYVITARLLSKTSLSPKLLKTFLEKVSGLKCNSLKMEATLLLVLIYQLQKQFDDLPQAALDNLCEGDWLVSCLQYLQSNGNYVYPILKVLVKKGAYYGISEDQLMCRELVKKIANEIEFDGCFVKTFLCLLLDEIVEETMAKEEINEWLQNIAKTMETKYHSEVELAIAEILKGPNYSSSQKAFLKTIFGSVNETYNAKFKILDDLYDEGKEISDETLESIAGLISNLKSGDQYLFSNVLCEKLRDHNPSTVERTLEFIIKTGIGEYELLKTNLAALFGNAKMLVKKWEKAYLLAASFLLEDLAFTWEIFVHLFPFIVIYSKKHLKYVRQLLKTKFFTESKLFSNFDANSFEDHDTFIAKLYSNLDNCNSEDVEEFLKLVSPLAESCCITRFSAVSILSHMFPSSLSALRESSVDLVFKLFNDFEKKRVSLEESSHQGYLEMALKKRVPVKGIVNCMNGIISKIVNTKFDWAKVDFCAKSGYSRFFSGLCSLVFKNDSFEDIFNSFLNFISADINVKMDVSLNICTSGIIEEAIICDILRYIRQKLLRSIKNLNHSNAFSCLYLILLFSNSDREVRRLAFDLAIYVVKHSNKTDAGYFWLLQQLLSYEDEIVTDSEQISLIFSNLLSSSVGNTRKNENLIAEILDITCSSETPVYVKAGVLKALSQVNNFKMLEKLCQHFLVEFENKGVFEKNETAIVSNLINRLDVAIMSRLTLKSPIWQLMAFILNSKKLIKLHTESIYLPSLLLSKLPRDTYAVVPEDVLEKLLDLICEVAVSSEEPEFVSTSSKIFKHIDLNAKLVSGLLSSMAEVQSTRASAMHKRKRTSFTPTVDILDTLEWKKGVCVLEFIQGKKKIRKGQCLLPLLFDILKKCLDFEEQTAVEYPKQLTLSLILLVCSKLECEEISEKDFNVELVIQCIRASQNPQTHYHALLALAHAAKFVPNEVLHHVMAIFTFMGSTLIRHDDAYSFEIISKIMDTIIPILAGGSNITTIRDVLRVFVDALLDVPEHRRIPLYVKLLDTVDAKANFHLFLLLALEAEVFHTTREKRKIEKGSTSERIKIVLNLCQEFPPEIILKACVLLAKHLNELPDEKDDAITTHKGNGLINITNYTPKQFRHYKYLIITFLSSLLSSHTFVNKISLLSDEENINIEHIYKELIINVLTYIQRTQRICEKAVNTPQGLYWKTVLYHSYDLLDNVNDLLTPRMFLLVTKGLLMHNLNTVKKRALELLNNKLQHNLSSFSDEEKTELYILIKPILVIIETIEEDNLQSDQETLIQTALLSLKLIVKTLGPEDPEKFVQILQFVAGILNSGKAQDNVLASVVLCLAELCIVLRGHGLAGLNSFMPAFLTILKSQKYQETSSMLLISVITTLSKLLDSFAAFLSPYLKKLICETSILISKWNCAANDPKSQALVSRLNGIKKKISMVIPPRILIPTVEECYNFLISKRYHNALIALIDILEEQLSTIQFKEISPYMSDLTNFFLKILQFRCDSGSAFEITNSVENQIVKTITVFVLKLSESTFRPFYLKLYDWAVRSGSDRERLITFYHLSESIGQALKGLFVLFAGIILNNLSDILRTITSENAIFHDKNKTILLLEFVLKTLQVIFTYDSKKFINRDRFELLMQPLVDLLEKDIDGIDVLVKRNEELITPTIVQFSVATADDSLWKEMNYQILLKMRNAVPEIRLAALHCLTEVVTKLRDDFLPLLPETIPFLAELLEDEDERVERSCQKAIREMEKVLGEPLQKYF